MDKLSDMRTSLLYRVLRWRLHPGLQSRIKPFAFHATRVVCDHLPRAPLDKSDASSTTPPSSPGIREDATHSQITTLERAERKVKRLQARFPPFSASSQGLITDIASGKTNSLNYLVQSIGNSTANLETVRAILHAETIRIKAVPKNEQVKVLQLQSRPLARTILSHIWTDRDLWYPLLHDQQAAIYLCYFALAEDLRPYLVKWLGIEDPAQDGWSTDLWRGWLLEDIVIASFMHTDSKKTASADLVLKIFFGVAAQKREESPSTLRRLNMMPAAGRISKTLGYGNYVRTDPRSFSNFIKFLEGFSHIARYRQYEIAKLHLSHPTEPDPQPAFALLQRLSQESKMENGAIDRSRLGTDWELPLKIFFIRLRKQLLRDGRPLDADWVYHKSHEVLGQKAPPRLKFDPLQQWMSRPIDQPNVRSKAEQAPRENNTWSDNTTS